MTTMHVPDELAMAAAALRRELEPHFAADTCTEGPEAWNPAHPVTGHNLPVAMVACTELPRRTGWPAHYVVAKASGEEHYILRVSGPEGEYDVDLTADRWGDVPVRITTADTSRRRETAPFVSADAYNMCFVLAARAGIMSEVNLAMTDRLADVLKHASSVGLTDTTGETKPLHLLVAVVSEQQSMAEAILILSGVDVESLRDQLQRWSTDDRGDLSEARSSGEVLAVLGRSQEWAVELGDPYWGEEHILLALTESVNSEVQEIMESFHITTGRLVEAWKQLMSEQ
jgi:hypothetical protein